MPVTDLEEATEELAAIAVEAGRVTLSLRGTTGGVRRKDDGTPQGEADRRADALIRQHLTRVFPGIPIVAEESGIDDEAAHADRFFLVDPLDGTRDYLGGRDEFTVNIALISGGRPIAGVVLAPALGEVFLGSPSGAIARRLDPRDLSPAGHERVLGPAPDPDPIRVVASRLHGDPRTEALLARLPAGRRLTFGSSLKFCRVAEGRADLYPRLVSIMEWDTAAGDAVLAAAGGATLDLSGEPLVYGKASAGWRSAPFVAAGRRDLAERAALLASRL